LFALCASKRKQFCPIEVGFSDLIAIGNALRLNRRKFVFARNPEDS
jgi:hypothetical protein